jgi:hypothetical protein
VDLSGCLSNPEGRESVGLAAKAVALRAVGDGSMGAPAPAVRPWRVADRLGENIIAELLAKSAGGMTQRSLAAAYSISLSSVKRLLASKGRVATTARSM